MRKQLSLYCVFAWCTGKIKSPVCIYNDILWLLLPAFNIKLNTAKLRILTHLQDYRDPKSNFEAHSRKHKAVTPQSRYGCLMEIHQVRHQI